MVRRNNRKEVRGATLHSVHKKTKKFITGKHNVDWVSGTSVANFLLKDPVIDWLNLYYRKVGLNNKRVTRSFVRKINQKCRNSSSSSVLMSNGLVFENAVYNALETKFPTAFVNLKCDCTEDAFQRVLTEMRRQTPIICQAYIKSDELKLRGVVDLLIRSDYVNQIVETPSIENDRNERGELYYVVVDIKWSHITLCVDGKTIRNSGRCRAYKGQLFIYNTILGELQNYTPHSAYILPKSWNVDSTMKHIQRESRNCFSQLCQVNFETRDNEYIEKTVEAINWVRNVRENGHAWTPMNPTIKEMCCNACNQDDTWASVKTEIMTHTRDITQIWMLTPEHRNTLFDGGIKRWDEQFDLDFLGEERRKVISNILKANRGCDDIIIDKIDNSTGWLAPSPNDLYVDYETISAEFAELKDVNLNPTEKKGTFIFMIGVGFVEKGEFAFNNYVCDEYQPSEEIRIVSLFERFLRDRVALHPNAPLRIFHWGCVERTLLDDFFKRHHGHSGWSFYKSIVWVDMYNVFVKSHIAVKGALCFKLKEISKALYKLGIVKTSWGCGDDAISNGMSAMTEAIQWYAQPHRDSRVMSNIIKYNHVDCKVLYEIVTYLRLVGY